MSSQHLKLSRVDDLIRPDHYHLREEDQCFFLREYTSHVGYVHSETNDLISNLKKPMDRRHNQQEWRWKLWAIKKASDELAEAVQRAWKAADWLLVPAPPAKTKSHALHDDRMVQIADAIGLRIDAQVVELLESATDREPQHSSTASRNVQAMMNTVRVCSVLKSQPKGVIMTCPQQLLQA